MEFLNYWLAGVLIIAAFFIGQMRAQRKLHEKQLNLDSKTLDCEIYSQEVYSLQLWLSNANLRIDELTQELERRQHIINAYKNTQVDQ